MIRKKDLKICISESFSYNDFPLLNSNGGHRLNDEGYDIFIGSWRIAQIIKAGNGKYLLSNSFTKFKSLQNAIKSLLKKLNNNGN